MKKIILGILFCMFCMALPACKMKDKERAITPVQEAWTQIRPEEDNILHAYTIDQDGNAFLVFSRMGEQGVWLSEYNPAGEETIRLELTNFFQGKTVQFTTICAENGTLYIGCCIFENMAQKALIYKFDMAGKRLDVLTEFPETGEPLRVLAGKECFYLLLGESYSFNGAATEKMAYRYDRTTKELTAIAMIDGMAEVMDISMNMEGNLILYVREENGKTCLLECSEEKNAVRVLKEFEKQKFEHFSMASETRLVYCDDEMSALVLSDITVFSDVIMVYPFGTDFDSQFCVVNDRSISRAENNSVVVVDLAQIEKNNKSIRLLTTEGYAMNKPFSCGFSMLYTEASTDKLALKVLAMDKDFDICLVRGDNSMNRAMKENANFYPLNDVAGIEEFFNECYPYVREAAKAEDGSIWMLPIRMDIPLIVGDTSAEGEISWPKDENITFEEYFGLLASLSDEQEQKAEKSYVQRSFLRSYIVRTQSVDTELFRKMMRLFQKKQDVGNRCVTGLPYMSIYEKGGYILRDVQFDTESVIWNSMRGYGTDAKIYTYPKLEKTEKNAGTCDYFVINPNSDHLKDVISFLESYISYVRNAQEKPFFFRTLDTQGNSVLEQISGIYENGEILFIADPGLYDGYNDVIVGKKDLEEYIRETDSKLKIYFEE